MDYVNQYIIPIDKAIQTMLGALVGIIFATIPYSNAEYQNPNSIFAIIAFCILILALLSIGFITSGDIKVKSKTKPRYIAVMIIIFIAAFFYPLYCYSGISGISVPEKMIYQIYSLMILVMMWLILSYSFHKQ